MMIIKITANIANTSIPITIPAMSPEPKDAAAKNYCS